jgi:hypothetical protein
MLLFNKLIFLQVDNDALGWTSVLYFPVHLIFAPDFGPCSFNITNFSESSVFRVSRGE